MNKAIVIMCISIFCLSFSKNNVNDATFKDLDSTKGIGTKKAKTIIQNKPYKDWEEFHKKNKGTIGEKVEKNLKKELRI